MIVYFSSLKKTQTGNASDRPWHVYSSPNSPHLCPVLAIAKYPLTQPDLLKETSTLFQVIPNMKYLLKKFTKLFVKTKKSLRNWE